MEELANTNEIYPDYFFVNGKGKVSENSFATRWRRIMPLVIAVIGVGLMAGGIFLNRSKTYQNTSKNKAVEGASLVSDSEFSRKPIMVDIGGAVERPGIVETSNDSRVQDVLISAGGLSAKADRIYISKNINLAQRVFDGMKLYFPFEGEVLGKNMGTVGGEMANTSTIININNASAGELDRLPGVGPVTANKIIAGRPYQNISELVSRKVVGKSVFEKIKGLVSTN